MPSRVLLTIASSDDSTTAARWARARSGSDQCKSTVAVPGGEPSFACGPSLGSIMALTYQRDVYCQDDCSAPRSGPVSCLLGSRRMSGSSPLPVTPVLMQAQLESGGGFPIQ